MNAPFLRWLSPGDQSRISRLQLFAKGVVEGMSGGSHRSKHIGASIEFKEHRPYLAGDETRNIDWKLFGKTDRLYVRQYEDETNLRCTISVDQSGSMKYCGTRSQGISKHEYAVRLAACFAYLLVNQHDAVGLALFDSKVRSFLPPRNQPNHLRLVFESLAKSLPAGESDLSEALQGLLPHCRRRGLVIVISDCFGDVGRVIKSLAALRSNHQEVVVFQVLDDDELDFPFYTKTLFRSLEIGSQETIVDPIPFRKEYLANLERCQQELRRGCVEKRVDLITIATSEPCADVVARYLARRRESP
ncbi:MAG: DUF58 domain-containing protein [Pirellula sp.]